MTFTFAKSAALAVLLALPMMAGAQTPFAGEDFDGGATNGGFTAATMSFTPDLSASTPIRSSFSGSSRFDRFGEISRMDPGGSGNEGIPFDIADDSASTFPGDRIGFVSASKTDDFVISADTTNAQNTTGAVSASWSFDITGRSNLELSMDFGMIGDFEPEDIYEFTYSIDGGPAALAFNVQGANNLYYSFTMDGGAFFERFTSPFFRSSEWEDVTIGGPTAGSFEYHIRDNGMDGDTVAQDGFVPVTFGTVVDDETVEFVELVRGYRVINSNGTFDQEEFAPARDPLTITSGDGELSAAMIPADFTNFVTKLAGTGSTLTLMLNGVSNGDVEYFAFDNILLSEGEDPGLAGDYNSDGKVDAADYTVWRDGDSPDSSQAGYDVWAANYGATSTPPAVSVPEPASLAVLLTAAAGVFAARRR